MLALHEIYVDKKLFSYSKYFRTFHAGSRSLYTKFKLTLGIVKYRWQNKKIVNKTKIKTDILSIIFTVFWKKIQKKYKLPCCYDNNLQILHVPKI